MIWKPSGPCGFALKENGGFSPRRRAVFFGLEGGFRVGVDGGAQRWFFPRRCGGFLVLSPTWWRVHVLAVGIWCRKNRSQMDIVGLTDTHFPIGQLRRTWVHLRRSWADVGSSSAILGQTRPNRLQDRPEDGPRRTIPPPSPPPHPRDQL